MTLTYRDGLRDGGLCALAPALGVEPEQGSPVHRLMGRRFTVEIDWIDEEPAGRDLDLARRMVRDAQQQAFEHGGGI